VPILKLNNILYLYNENIYIYIYDSYSNKFDKLSKEKFNLEMKLYKFKLFDSLNKNLILAIKSCTFFVRIQHNTFRTSMPSIKNMRFRFLFIVIY